MMICEPVKQEKLFRNINLEMSLKPFKKNDDEYVKEVCTLMFKQWRRLIDRAEAISVMLWCSDGSEILEYKGDLEEEFEWAKYIGGANPRSVWDKKSDPLKASLHNRNYLYINEPPVFTYGKLKRIVKIIRDTAKQVCGGKETRIGATFDPGPEFAKSDFKYVRHNEICPGDTMGKGSFVCCYGVLEADSVSYAGFPEGIPGGTPFGTFLGRQSRHFLNDLGFDFIWFSNGLGFGAETWKTTGALFDGEGFLPEKYSEIKEKILAFWKLFRAECPDLRVETRGTNMTAGIDLATDGVPLRDIYNGGFNMLPPPNSPWAALNGDFGLEIAGYLSRMAELPSDEYLFRFYVHDPWWLNSPWIDRYEGQPHDIFLPMAASRMDAAGEVCNPTHLSLLTIDNSLGDMPWRCPDEIAPHIIESLDHSPDAPSPVVWAYPFDEYHDMTGRSEEDINEVFFGDWFIRSAINNGLPVSTVVSTKNFALNLSKNPGIYSASVIVAILPDADSKLEKTYAGFIRAGGKMLFYGPVRRAGSEIKELLNISAAADAVSGELKIKINPGETGDDGIDVFENGRFPDRIMHREMICAGPVETVLADINDKHTALLAEVWPADPGDCKLKRSAAIYRSCPEWMGGAAAWVRGTSSNSYKKGAHLLTPDDPELYFPGEILMRYALSRLGFSITFKKTCLQVKSPVIMLHRHDNAFWFSGYMPDTTAAVSLKTELGAPLLIGCETQIIRGRSSYYMPRAWKKECRIFLEPESGNKINGADTNTAKANKNCTVICRDMNPVAYGRRRRLRIEGLKNATLRIFPEKYCGPGMEVMLNPKSPFLYGEEFEGEWVESRKYGSYFEIRNASGTVMVTMPHAVC